MQKRTAADQAAYTCQADGTFTQPTTGPAALTSSDTTKIASANAWLTSMMAPDVNIVTSSTITPDQDYTSSYTGATAGSFAINGRTYSTVATSSIVVDSPGTVPDSYRGVINAHVTMTPTPNRWIIQAYKNNGGTITQVPVQALADGTTGHFSIDLTGVSGSYTGQWMLGVLDANAGYAEYGTKWPSPDQYVNLVVQELVVTDTTYLWATTPASADNRFSFPNDQVGAKMFRLVDSSTNEVLAESFDQTGLIRSYEYQLGETGYGTGIQDLTYVYDQSLALFSAVGQNQSSQAKQLVDGLLKMQTTSGVHNGGFVFAAPQLSPSYTDDYYRTGADAIAVDALLAYIKAYPSDGNISAYTAAAVQGLTFLQSLYSSSGPTAGLYLGGYGQYSGSPQVFDPSYVVTFASTEHNIDVWHALTDASRILGNSVTNYALLANNLDTAMTNSLYNTSLGRFNQGINGGTTDTGDPLDVNTWGAIQMYATGRTTQAQAALTHLNAFANTISGVSGYAPFYDSSDYPGALANVWFEGSFGAALAQYDAGNYASYRTLIDGLTSAQQVDGSFKYSQVEDSTYGISISKSVASTAWYILATAGRASIWNTCMYLPPAVTPSSTSSGVTPVSPTTSTTAKKPSSISVSDLANSATPEDSSTANAAPSTTPVVSKPQSTSNTTEPKTADASTSPLVLVISGVAILAVAGGIWATAVRLRHRRDL
ncbi:MAG: hypothetical protein JWN26_81 [Candidatus Saccharibacteria bacterium]|nr:hypothetical protein [Candidatus Saccharibacteria bacterium]